MKLHRLLKLFASGQATLLLGILRDARRFYRLVFVSTAFQEGVYQAIGDGPTRVEAIAASLGMSGTEDGLRAWLDFGVSLQELACDERGYRVIGRLSRRLAAPANDAALAVLEEIADLHYAYIRRSPELLRTGRRFPLAAIDGPLIARSSRSLESLVADVVEDAVSQEGALRLLEVGCGSGIYMQAACAANPSLTALGLELNPEVAAMARKHVDDWGLRDRVRVEAGSILDFASDERFDLVTLHNNIYYFPVERRVALLQKLCGLLNPSGRILLTTGCQDHDPAMRSLDLIGAMTEGMGRLPGVDELVEQLRTAGFVQASNKRLTPMIRYYAFTAARGT